MKREMNELRCTGQVRFSLYSPTSSRQPTAYLFETAHLESSLPIRDSAPLLKGRPMSEIRLPDPQLWSQREGASGVWGTSL